ncbi:hypothetical protein DRH14_00995 [Candidatus Shapirobacteria bacterium]|nr:MAG: hypothetical protein DRH14_00995 [Candidatus Shapirobacteria bacterium]
MTANLKKYLYLLQLEEYDNQRFISWIKKNDIDQLTEKKGKLKYTLKIISIFPIVILLSPFFKTTKSIIVANNFLNIFRFIIKKTTIFLAKTKLLFFPKLHKIIITGSYGKTTFKEKLTHVLSSKYLVLKTPDNLNTEIAIAKLILFHLKQKHAFLIIEAGAYQPGDIRKICQFVKPNIGIVTIIGWMHLERFKNINQIRKTKLEIIPFIKNKNNLFFPKNNHEFINTVQTINQIANKFHVNHKEVNLRLKTFPKLKHRLTIDTKNPKLIIIDDTYNSNPLGFKKALLKLKTFSKYQKILVTPGMIELGNKQYNLNKQIIKFADKIVDIFIIVGKTNQKAMIDGLCNSQHKILTIKSNQNWGQILSPHLKPPTAILLENQLPDHYF